MPRDPASPHEKPDAASGPPGHFLSDDLKSDTERFLRDVKRLVRRRRDVEREGAEPRVDAASDADA